MMRRGALSLTCIFALAAAIGPAMAVELPDWARSVDLRTAQEAFPEGKTLQLFASQDLEVDASGGRTFRIREILFVREGKAEGHNVVVFVSSDERKLRGMRAWKRDAGGRVELFDSPISSQLLGGELYAEDKENSIKISGIGPGALIAIELSFTDESPDFRTDATPARADLPVMDWEYRLKLPEGWRAEGFWYDPIVGALERTDPASAGKDWITWRRERIPSYGEEETFAPSEAATAPLFLVRYGHPNDSTMGTWKSIADWFRPLSESALEDAGSLRASGEKILGDADGFDTKVARIADWVRASIGYVQIYLGDGGFRPHPVGQVHANRFGDCKDMSHLAIAMLENAGIRVHPVLTNIGDRGRGRIQPGFPTAGFNHCIVAIERPAPDSGFLYFDPTSKTIPIGRLSYPLEGAPALVVGTATDSALTYLPRREPAANGVRVDGIITIAPGLRAIARIRELRLGQRAYASRELLLAMSPEERARWVQDWIEKRYVGARADSIAFPDLTRICDTLTIRYVARIPEIGRIVGNLAMVQPDFVTTWDARHFPRPERRRPIHFAYPYRNEAHIEIRFPEEWSPGELPVEVGLENPIASYRRRYDAGIGAARVERTEEVRLADVPASDYRLLQEWDRAVSEADRQRFVLNLPSASRGSPR